MPATSAWQLSCPTRSWHTGTIDDVGEQFVKTVDVVFIVVMTGATVWMVWRLFRPYPVNRLGRPCEYEDPDEFRDGVARLRIRLFFGLIACAFFILGFIANGFHVYSGTG